MFSKLFNGSTVMVLLFIGVVAVCGYLFLRQVDAPDMGICMDTPSSVVSGLSANGPVNVYFKDCTPIPK